MLTLIEPHMLVRKLRGHYKTWRAFSEDLGEDRICAAALYRISVQQRMPKFILYKALIKKLYNLEYAPENIQ